MVDVTISLKRCGVPVKRNERDKVSFLKEVEGVE